MAKLLYRLFVLVLGLNVTFTANATNEKIMVVANTSQQIELTRQEVRKLFMGTGFVNDMDAVVLPPNSPTRVVFNTKVIGLTESRIQSYWAQMRFTGRGRPPTQIPDINALLDYLSNNEGAVGYLPESIELPSNLTVVYREE